MYTSDYFEHLLPSTQLTLMLALVLPHILDIESGEVQRYLAHFLRELS